MHLKKLVQAGACILAVAMTGVNVAEAGVVVGGSIGQSAFDYPDVENGSYKKFYLGFELAESPVYFEFQGMNSGDAEIDDLPDTTLNVSGTQFGLGYRVITNPDTGSGFFLKGGIYSTDTELSDPNGFTIYGPGTATQSGSGLYLGLGGDLMLNPNFGFRLDLEGLIGVKDFVEDNDVTVFSVGPVIKFGGASE